MNQSAHRSDMEELEKGLQRVGLSLSEPELRQLSFGHIISLEKMELSTIGTLFLLASAASALNLGCIKKPIAFQDLPKATQDCQECSGIPIYCWNSEFSGKRSLYLAVVEGNPAVRACCHVLLKRGISPSSIALKS